MEGEYMDKDFWTEEDLKEYEAYDDM